MDTGLTKAEVIDVDLNQIVVRTRGSYALLEAMAEHETRVGDVLEGTLDGDTVEALRNMTADTVLVAFVDSGETKDRTIF